MPSDRLMFEVMGAIVTLATAGRLDMRLRLAASSSSGSRSGYRTCAFFASVNRKTSAEVSLSPGRVTTLKLSKLGQFAVSRYPGPHTEEWVET
jgi:hypothetical protein